MMDCRALGNPQGGPEDHIIGAEEPRGNPGCSLPPWP